MSSSTSTSLCCKLERSAERQAACSLVVTRYCQLLSAFQVHPQHVTGPAIHSRLNHLSFNCLLEDSPGSDLGHFSSSSGQPSGLAIVMLSWTHHSKTSAMLLPRGPLWRLGASSFSRSWENHTWKPIQAKHHFSFVWRWHSWNCQRLHSLSHVQAKKTRHSSLHCEERGGWRLFGSGDSCVAVKRSTLEPLVSDLWAGLWWPGDQRFYQEHSSGEQWKSGMYVYPTCLNIPMVTNIHPLKYTYPMSFSGLSSLVQLLVSCQHDYICTLLMHRSCNLEDLTRTVSVWTFKLPSHLSKPSV